MMRLGWIRGFVVLFSGDDVFHEAIPPLVGKVTHGLQDVPKGKFVIVKSGVSEMKVTHGLQDVPKGKFVIMKSGVSEMNLVTVNSNSGFRFKIDIVIVVIFFSKRHEIETFKPIRKNY